MKNYFLFRHVSAFDGRRWIQQSRRCRHQPRTPKRRGAHFDDAEQHLVMIVLLLASFFKVKKEKSTYLKFP